METKNENTSEVVSGDGPSPSASSEWLGRPSVIQRQKCPGRYAGMNAQGFPIWTSGYADTKKIPAGEVQAELNRVAAHEPMVWAVLYPQNSKDL